MPPIQDFFSFLPFLHIHHCQNIHYHFIFYSDDHTTQPAPGKSLAPQYRGLLLLELSVSTTWIRLHPGFHLIICWQLVLIHFFFFFQFSFSIPRGSSIGLYARRNAIPTLTNNDIRDVLMGFRYKTSPRRARIKKWLHFYSSDIFPLEKRNCRPVSSSQKSLAVGREVRSTVVSVT